MKMIQTAFSYAVSHFCSLDPIEEGDKQVDSWAAQTNFLPLLFFYQAF